jgi:F0F1-type ATP synthase gamma subunit
VGYAYALRKIMMATNKFSRSEEAFADTRVYSEAVEERVRSLALRLLKRLFGEIA